MSAQAAAMSRSWSVGNFTATLTVPKAEPGKVASAVIEWSPTVPTGLTAEELERYRAGRDEAIRALGLKAVVVEL